MKKVSWLWTVLFTAETAFLLYMAVQPSTSVPGFHLPFFRGGDFEHFLAYLVYGILGYKTFSLRFGPEKGFQAALLVCCLFGGITEGIQMFVPTRTADLVDWLVDALGAGTGVLALKLRIQELARGMLQ